MNRGRSSAFWWGILLVVAGVVWLLNTLGVVVTHPAWPGLLFGAAGLGFTYLYARGRENWWAAIPAGAFLGIAGLLTWGALAPPPASAWGVSIFLGGLGAGFWAAYLRTPERWWAIIPGGVLGTLGLFVGLTSVLGGAQAVAFLFFGLALTFALLAMVSTDKGRMRWPLVPSAVLGVLGVLFAMQATTVLRALDYVWPVVLLAAGLYLIVRAFGSGLTPRPHP